MGIGFPAEPKAQTRRNRWLLVLCLLASVLLIERAAGKQLGVLLRNQEFGARFLAREDPYFDAQREERIHGPYPPSFALVSAPLSLLPTPLARRLWCAAQIGALWALYALLRRRTREHWPGLVQHVPMLFALALLLTSRYVLRDTKGGGGNLLYITLALIGVEESLRGHATRGGIALALGLVLKPNLAPLLLFLALRRRVAALLTAALAATLLFFAPALYFGPAAYLQVSQRWATDVIAYASLEDLHSSALVPAGLPAAEYGMNQSLREAVHRFMRPPGDSGAFDVQLIHTTPRVAIRTSQLLGLLLLLALGWRAWGARSSLAEWFALLGFLPLCLLLSPVTWKAHHAILLPLMFALVAIATNPGARQRWLVRGLWLYYLVCNMASVDILGDRAGDYLQAISVVAWADVALVGVSVVLMHAVAREAARQTNNPDPSTF